MFSSFSFGLTNRSKNDSKSGSRRKRSHARERTRPREYSVGSDDQGDNYSDLELGRGEPRKPSKEQETSTVSEDSHRQRTRSGNRHTASSDTRHSSSSSLRSRHTKRSADPMTATARSSELRNGYSDSKSSLPYPQFSKAHSREAPTSREDLTAGRSPYTPAHTDAGDEKRSKHSGSARGSWNVSRGAPPSPPLTASSSNLRRAKSSGSVQQQTSLLSESRTVPKRVNLEEPPSPTKSESPAKSSSPVKNLRFSASRSSLRAAEEGIPSPDTTPWSSHVKSQSRSAVPENALFAARGDRSTPSSPSRKTRASSLRDSQKGSTMTSSDATSVTAGRKHGYKAASTIPMSGPSTIQGEGSQMATPVAHLSEVAPGRMTPSAIEIFTDDQSVVDVPTFDAESGSLPAPPPPPPPPPPPNAAPSEPPRVDYLLQNGGLSKSIPKQFSLAPRPPPPQLYQQYSSPQAPNSAALEVPSVYTPYSKLLDSYLDVLSRNGSLAVATGYRSVARRLLDRLESVFARNISSEFCDCAMCRADRLDSENPTQDTGVSWGEVLELVSGRRDLPAWPPFQLPSTATSKTSSKGLGLREPMQELDKDIPQEYEAHYRSQSRKTKHSVDKWLDSQPSSETTPPTDVDDETLTFTMLTYLPKDQRPVFTALVRRLRSIPDLRSPTPLPTSEDRINIMPKIAIALQRLYRLPSLPRDPECAMFLLNNASLHSALATLSAISSQEWDILVSGRFDGFLVSGAESQFPSMGPVPSRGPTPYARGASRGPTPFRGIQSRGPTTPGPNGQCGPAPVQVDEETEIAVLSEIEREIFLGMDQLEDQLEALHVKAESVRNALIERSCGLNQQAQSRRNTPDELRAVMGTPFTGMGEGNEEWSGSPATPFRPGSVPIRPQSSQWYEDAAFDDTESLAPDDSASNIGFSQRRRKHRHRERKAKSKKAAPVEVVEEEDESEA